MSVDPDPFDAYQELLRARTRWRLMRTLNRLGVETAICSLGRVDERVVFVLGARYPDESVSQVAIDKTTFLPVRLLLVDQNSDTAGSRLEIVYRNWEKLQSGWFPMQVQFSMDNRLVREIRVASLRLNTSISVETMDPEVLKASGRRQRARNAPGAKTEGGRSDTEGSPGFPEKIRIACFPKPANMVHASQLDRTGQNHPKNPPEKTKLFIHIIFITYLHDTTHFQSLKQG